MMHMRLVQCRPTLPLTAKASRLFVQRRPSRLNAAMSPDLLDATMTRKALNVSFEPFYRVILHYSSWADSNKTAKIVAKAVPIVSFSHALHVVKSAEVYNQAILVTVLKNDAEMYQSRLKMSGYNASIESA
jgi:hypothetical protein